jgi:phosphatidylserine decarboxylase
VFSCDAFSIAFVNRATYQPYDALRQRFWRQYLKQYDTDDTGRLSHLELTSMLDSLNSTLTRSTIASFFTRFGKEPKHDELTLDEAVMCLETELGRPESEKRRIGEDEGEGESGAVTPMMISAGSGSSGGVGGGAGAGGEALELEKMDFSGPAVHPAAIAGGDGNEPLHPTEPAQLPLSMVAIPRQPSDSSYDDSDEGDGDGEGSSTSASASGNVGAGPGPGDVSPALTPSASGGKFKKARFRRKGPKSAKSKSKSTPIPTAAGGADDSFERVINVRSCPLCRRPRMNDRAEVDIVTHMAVCASQDWNKVDRIVVGNFVTASQAQRKWYTRVLSKVSSGDYRLGAVCGFFSSLTMT